jgi:hypothetical protein
MATDSKIQRGKDILPRYLHGASFRARKAEKKSSQTPGKKKAISCQLTLVGGLPRKAWSRSRSYKNKRYSVYCAFMDSLNK